MSCYEKEARPNLPVRFNTDENIIDENSQPKERKGWKMLIRSKKNIKLLHNFHFSSSTKLVIIINLAMGRWEE